MINDLNTFQSYLELFLNDERVTVWHMALMFAICQLASSSDIGAPIFICRRQLMKIGHISNFMTYHKYLAELQTLGYISYFPSYHPGIRSRVYLKTDSFKLKVAAC